MVLDLKGVFATVGASLPIDYSVDMSETSYAGTFPLKSPVEVRGSVFNSAGVVTLRIEMSYVFDAPCDRCGVETVHSFTLPFERSLAVSIEAEESDTIIAVPDMKLCVDELVFSEVYMDLPSKHLCSEDCKGLCFKCGKNLNEGKCGCPEKEIDPRLSKLAELLEN